MTSKRSHNNKPVPFEPRHPTVHVFTTPQYKARQAFDYRASHARAHRREDKGETVLMCPSCHCELDVDYVVHERKCKVLRGAA